MKTSQVAIDASFLLKLFLPEKESGKAEKLWRGWIEDSTEIVAPTLLVFEVSSVLRNKAFSGPIAEEDAGQAVLQLRDLEITLVYMDDLLIEAWETGKTLRSPALYDCFYIALSRFLKIPLWTADKKLHNAAKRHHFDIHLLD